MKTLPKLHSQLPRPSGSLEPCLDAHSRLVDALRVHYQPIISLADMQPQAVEVLARCEAGDGAIRGPETILEAMTNASDSIALTGAILHRALAELPQAGLTDTDLCFAINLPLDAMLHPDLLAIIESIRTGSVLAPHQIRFELTERHAVTDIGKVAEVIAVLRQAGYLLALDDIIPQMPNLAALLELPLHAIKFDRSVVTSQRPADHDFIRNIATHAKANSQQTVAEGIETATTLARMIDLQITHGQGFLFSHPLPAPELLAFLGRQPVIAF